MPAYNQCHPQVVRTLEREGWEVRRSPLFLDSGERTLFVDLELVRKTQDQDERIMVVEVKCFPPSSAETTELYVSLGQYLVYRGLFAQNHIDAYLYLAVPIHTYEGVFHDLARSLLDALQIKLVIIDLDREVIVQWLR
jgi:hypothetical protein